MLTDEDCIIQTNNAKINIRLRVKEHRNDTGMIVIKVDQLLRK